MNFDYGKYYGVKPEYLGLNSPATASQQSTVRNKIAMIDRLVHLQRTVESLISTARRIPVEDDERHAALVDLLMKNLAVGIDAVELAKENAEEGYAFSLYVKEAT